MITGLMDCCHCNLFAAMPIKTPVKEVSLCNVGKTVTKLLMFLCYKGFSVWVLLIQENEREQVILKTLQLTFQL